MMAQAIRAILLASATAATFVGRRSINRPSQGRFCVPCLRAQRITAIAPTTSNHRKYRLPCLVMLPNLSLPPVVCCFGTNPIQAATLRPDENVFQSPISATNAVAPTGPMPGCSWQQKVIAS
jgi:hypothetical protein